MPAGFASFHDTDPRAPSLFALGQAQERAQAETRYAAALADAMRGAAAHAPTPEAYREGVASAFLGTKGKSSDKARDKRNTSDSDDLLSNRARRFKLQRMAQRLLDAEAVAGCQRNQNRNGPGVKLVENAKTKATGYRGLFTCGSVWHCPCCANVISERRRAELQAAIAAWQAKGGKVYLLTLTIPHQIDHKLHDLLQAHARALKLYKQTAAYKRMRNATGHVGTVRALEVTHGQNGWHPHTHELMFCAPGANVLDEIERTRDYWAQSVSKAGLGQINEHGFKAHGADAAADYVTKFGDTRGWDLTHEMTRAHIKKGRAKGRTPFALLHDYMAKHDSQAGALFVEYAEEFKGKRQLFWSPGLKELLGIEVVDDQAICEQDQEFKEGEQDRVIWSFTPEEWSLVVRSNRRGELLDVATHGTDAVYTYLQLLKVRPGAAGFLPRGAGD